MHKKIVNFVKYNKFFLSIYKALGNILISFLKIIVKTDDKKILFMAFGGQKYNDSPKALYEQMKKDPFFSDYEFIWAFSRPSMYESLDCRKVKVDTLAFYVAAISSRLWINNSSVSRGLNIKGKNNIEINTLHGTPLKKLGEDININKSFGFAEKNSKKADNTYYCSQSIFNQEVYARILHTDKAHILLSDLPRNDELVNYTQEEVCNIKRRLGFDLDKKIILYAPTFREYDRNSSNSCYISPPIDKEKWRKRLGKDYIVLVRAHYEVVDLIGFDEDDSLFVNVSEYECLNDLIMISDMLISDYSSVYFDYSITQKPMFNFSYDFEQYNHYRGLYEEPARDLPCKINYNEDDLLQEIIDFDYNTYIKKAELFRNKYVPYAGNASKIVINKIKEILEN